MFKTIKIFSVAVLLVFALSVGGCNTMVGVGKDLQAAGEALSGSANSHQGY
ncbi:MAG: entericidin A/B family lipoprotein [Micavibrio sp.]|nr:MAG: entericidin A/B family lipoprotein [Micavibrio sp.]